jgi:glycerol-3-phosphate dehydrogenase
MITRDPDQAASRRYDVIVVGGGIYGVALCWLAARSGLSVLLLEREDFGHATSFNHLRIIHGGFRYLQNLDLARFFESVGERRWLLTHFSNRVRPLPCLMPLYDRGLHRVPVLRLALRLNDLLSRHRNEGVGADRQLPDGAIVSREEVMRIFPEVVADDLRGGAIWHDGSVDDPQRLLIEWLGHACQLGATALNYVEARDLLSDGGKLTGVAAQDLAGGGDLEFHGDIVINAAGPWCRALAAGFEHGRDREELFRPSLAFNVLFERPALSDHALALTPPRPGGTTLVLRPWYGRLLAGTVHEPWRDASDVRPQPGAATLAHFIADLNLAAPRLELTSSEVLRVFAGFLPARRSGSAALAVRETILDHGAAGGPQGLWSVSGVKYTTARLVAEKTLSRIFPERQKRFYDSRRALDLIAQVNGRRGLLPAESWPLSMTAPWREQLEEIITEESVIHLDDLIFRRTNLGNHPPTALKLAPALCELLPWDAGRAAMEVERLRLCMKECR